MAQAKHVPSAISPPITGAEATPSTKPAKAGCAEFVARPDECAKRRIPVEASAIENPMVEARLADAATISKTKRNDAPASDLGLDVSGIPQHTLGGCAGRVA
jgi:hypothetical protein